MADTRPPTPTLPRKGGGRITARSGFAQPAGAHLIADIEEGRGRVAFVVAIVASRTKPAATRPAERARHYASDGGELLRLAHTKLRNRLEQPFRVRHLG